MAGLLGQIRKLNELGNHSIAEPFAGGAGASLSLLFMEETPEIHINDADPAIYAFWWILKNRPMEFSKMLSSTRISMAEWRRQRTIYRSGAQTSRLALQLPICFKVRALSGGLVSSTPE
jgi:DNA adenine methylase